MMITVFTLGRMICLYPEVKQKYRFELVEE